MQYGEEGSAEIKSQVRDQRPRLFEEEGGGGFPRRGSVGDAKNAGR